PIGLDANLAIAEGLIKATLLEGDYLATHAFGWTQFEIDPTSQMLTVTTYGIDATPRTNSSPAPPPSPPVSPASLAASRSSPKGCRWCHPSHCCSPGCSF
ncbi:MAG TPA: hypothetical protein VES73_04745, partial [Lamprocystis sp. (in: g-proteobacteria)]|nr:hypothetical protein [Lamprocystis sp. (in: g-proteobacteria)]